MALSFAVSSMVTLAWPLAYADVNSAEHGGSSDCFLCHTVEDPSDPPCMKCHWDFYLETYNPAAHKIVDGLAYTTCGDGHCHVDLELVLSTSVHQSLNCGACHSPLHVSLYEDGMGAWLFVNRLNNSGAIAYKPSTPVSFNKTVYFFDTTNDTSSLGSSISNWGGEIHWAWTNVSGVASGISSSSRYLTCMNCHFLTTNPAEAGLTKMISGSTYIAIPEFSLNLSPHSLTDDSLKETVSRNKQLEALGSNFGFISTIIACMGIAGLVILRKRI
jgi:hypothetical protein